ncbi:MAG: HNH endonuclease [Bacteroidetes bacterium]|nr:HNH endonuclease [Bacteroidota bacterium]
MPRDKNLRKKYYQELCERDGERCRICGRTQPEVYLEVDHKNGKKDDNHLENLQLLCRNDNRKKNPRGKGKGNIVKRRVISLQSFNEIMDSSRMSPEMAKNKQAEPKFRHWLYRKISDNGPMTVQQVVNSGAEYAGCSTHAIRTNYLPKCTSEEGIFRIYHDEEKGKNLVAFRNAEAIGVFADAIDVEILDERND